MNEMRFNSERYPDPTVYLAMRNIERAERRKRAEQIKRQRRRRQMKNRMRKDNKKTREGET